MTILEKLTLVYTANTYVYTTNQTAAQVRANIEFVINQKEIFDFQFNLTGTLNKDNTFQLVRRMGLITINSYLTHKYYKSEFEKALDLSFEEIPVKRGFEF